MSCYGKILYVTTDTSVSSPERQFMSMTRLARDPYMLYCVLRSAQAEAVGGVQLAGFVGYEDQFVHPAEWQKASHEPVAFLEARAITDGSGGQPLPLPMKQSWDPPLQNLEIAAEGARRAIQAAMGVSPLPTSAQRRNEKSGVALRQIESSAQKGTFHFTDSYDHMVRQVGVITEDLIPTTYDTPRDVGVIGADEESRTVRINDPDEDEPISTRGDHQTTISTGPAFESQREAASQFADQLAGNPDIFRLIQSKSKPRQSGNICWPRWTRC